MSLIRAGGLTTLILAVLTTAALVGFSHWYTGHTPGETIGQVLLWFPISLFVSAPVGLIVFPLLYTVLGIGGRPSAKLFALVGGVIGAAVAGYALFRFRGHLAVNPSVMFVALPLLVLLATMLGVFAGFIFERMARRAPQLVPPLRALQPEDPLPPPHPGDIRSRRDDA